MEHLNQQLRQAHLSLHSRVGQADGFAGTSSSIGVAAAPSNTQTK